MNLQWSRIFFWTLPQMCGLMQTCFWALQAVILTSGLGLCSDMHYKLLEILLRCVPFQIIPIQLNLPQVTFTQSVVTSTSNMNAPELNFNCSRYGYEYLIFIFYKFAKMFKTCFSLYLYGVGSVDCCWKKKKSNLKQFNIRQYQNKTWKN